MKCLLSLLLLLFVIGCQNQPANTIADTRLKDTIIKHDTIYITDNKDEHWQDNAGFNLTHDPDKDSIWGKPVSYYLNDPECVSIAFEFYYGYFRPTDNGATDELLKYATTSNKKLRPFYRWCLDKTIEISDGALSEHVGTPAINYVEKYPKEFLAFIDSDTGKTKYNNWTSAIAYSGFDTNNPKDQAQQTKDFLNTMKKNCVDCDAATLQRIEKLAKDCHD
ncbi:hypothetical protein [Ferruginibacter profundus]